MAFADGFHGRLNSISELDDDGANFALKGHYILSGTLFPSLNFSLHRGTLTIYVILLVRGETSFARRGKAEEK
uniref:Uncharacterized protein n=1 Tax=Candidatus Kentrum sp. LPFa TaxID=2126335 RepID=A0A450WZ70_9GAMM|nr:MAG: hypothetical protein BECKLPF1236A_GA0070988_103433 [Candidatus Kentron sp. LPFa]VFK35164.1 MAG: hypothetical protein BECKLPF1236C_GA0070990_103403 [Candidatus Kentron sp. LPFa]